MFTNIFSKHPINRRLGLKEYCQMLQTSDYINSERFIPIRVEIASSKMVDILDSVGTNSMYVVTIL